MKPVCPKCRALGLDTDCADLLLTQGHTPVDEQPYELEVSLTFSTLGPPDALADPHELAAQMRDRWLDEPKDLVTAITDAIADEDYTLKVLPGFGA